MLFVGGMTSEAQKLRSSEAQTEEVNTLKLYHM
jgi:hypothetical protein